MNITSEIAAAKAELAKAKLLEATAWGQIKAAWASTAVKAAFGVVALAGAMVGHLV